MRVALRSENAFAQCIQLAVHLVAVLVLVFGASPSLAETSWYVSAGFTQMELDSNSEEIVLSQLSGASQLALEEGPIEGSGVKALGDGQPSVTIGYRFERVPQLSLETVVAPPFNFDLEFTGALKDQSVAPFVLGGLPTGIEPFGEQFATTRALPATLTLVYQFNSRGRFRPYIGAGLTVIYTFDHKIKNQALVGENPPRMEVDLAVGQIVQLGLISRLSKRVSLVAEVKSGTGIAIDGRMLDITLSSPDLSDIVGPAMVGQGELSVSIDATVYNLSLQWDL